MKSRKQAKVRPESKCVWPAIVYLSALLLAATACLADPLSVVSVRVNSGSDDAEEAADTKMKLTESGLNIGSKQWVGARFRNTNVPKGVTIMSATLTFQARGNSTGTPAASTIFAEASDDASTFTTTNGSISSRPRTAASLSINPVPPFFDNWVITTPDISELIQEVIDRPGWASDDIALHVRADATADRAIDSYEGSSSTAPLLRIEYTPNPRPVAPDLLFVVVNPASLSAQESIRQEWFKWWAYRITLIDESDSQANYNTAIAANDVAFVSEQVLSTNLNTKLKAAPIGVVFDEPALIDDFGLAPSYATPTANSFQVASNTHYITFPFSIGALPMFSSSPPGIEASGTLAKEAVTLGTFSGGGPGLVTMEAGGILTDSTKAAGRRVALPWGGNGMDFNTINSDGLNVLKRSIEWAAGVQAHWKLDETTGTTVADSGPNVRPGTLSGTTFAIGSISPAKLDRGLNLDGVNDYVSIPHHSTLQLTKALTISAWIKADAFGTGSDVDPILRKGDSAPAAYQLCIQNGRLTFHLNETDGTGSGTIGNTPLETGRWYHVAATWDGSQASVYVNGTLDCTPRAVAGTLPLDTRTLYLGARSGTDLSDGIIDDVRLYNYALTASEVKNLRGINQPRGVRVTKWIEVQ